MKRMWIMRENASDLILQIMIWAIGTILATRYWLEMMGWPTISFGDWHIAHVLWGGLLMMVAMILIITNYGRRILKIGAIIFGIGWGLFIDEIGKYLTKDNDYWFQPAIIFIYISFIVLFLIYRYIDKLDDHTNLSLLYSVMADTEKILDGELTKKTKDKILLKIDKYIKQESGTDKKQFALEYKKVIDQIITIKKQKTAWSNVFSVIANFSYKKILRKKLIELGLAVYSLVYVLEKIIDTYRLFTTNNKLEILQNKYYLYDFLKTSDFYMIGGKIFFEIIVALTFGIGIYYAMVLRKTKKALTWFQYGLLISIFFASVFRFYFEQFGGVMDVLISIGIYYAVTSLKMEKLGKK